MTAREALHPQLFHGTAHDLDGTRLQPSLRMGASGGQDVHAHRGQSNREVVSVSGDESKAWRMATISGPGRARVFEVEPHPETKVGVEHPDHPAYQEHNHGKYWHAHHIEDNAEYVAPHFDVKKQIDIKPAYPGTHGRQGTIPNVDWNKHAKMRPGPGGYPDANHPEPLVSPPRLLRSGNVQNGVLREAYEMNGDHDARLFSKGPTFHDRRGEGPKGTQEALF